MVLVQGKVIIRNKLKKIAVLLKIDLIVISKRSNNKIIRKFNKVLKLKTEILVHQK